MSIATTARASLAALVLGAAPALAGGPEQPWTGFYVGVHGGHGWADLNGTLTYDPGTGHVPGVFDPADRAYDMTGRVGGIQAGYNLQFGHVVVGIEGDAAAAAIAQTQTHTTPSGLYDWRIGVKLKGMETLRLRVGVASGRVLVFATGGIALGHTEGKLHVTSRDGFSPPANTANGSATEAHFGYAVGGGAEIALTDHITIGFTYLYTDLGDADYHLKGAAYPSKPPCGSGPISSNCSFPHTTDSFPAELTFQSVRGSLNVKF